METSKRITSGARANAFSTASLPSVASPHTLQPLCISRSIFRPARTIGTSSAMRILSIALPPLLLCTDRKERDRERNAGPGNELVFCYQDKMRVEGLRIG